jgi:hypothetical protein
MHTHNEESTAGHTAPRPSGRRAQRSRCPPTAAPERPICISLSLPPASQSEKAPAQHPDETRFAPCTRHPKIVFPLVSIADA